MKYEKKYGNRSNIGRGKYRPARKARPLEVAIREPVSHIPRTISAQILSNSKNKLTAKARKRMMKSRQSVINNLSEAGTDKSEWEKFTNRVAQWNMSQLTRKMTQCPNRIRIATKILADLSPDSMFAPAIRRVIAINQLVFSAVKAEIKRRTESPAVRDARTPRIRKAALNQTN